MKLRWIGENWFKIIIVGIFAIVAITVVNSEMETAKLNKWSRLCSKISETELQIRIRLDMKYGDKEKEWCKKNFYNFFK